MSWTNNGGGKGKGPGKGPGQGGPWGQGGGNPGPWGQGPGSNRPQAPDLGEVWNQLQERFGNWRGGGGGRGGGLGGGFGLPGAGILIVIAVGLWLLSGFYTIGPNQVGLNLVFGKYVGKTAPGLNYNWPYPIGAVEKLNVTDRNAFNVGFTTRRDFSRPNAVTQLDVPEESLMLTGDENIADVKFVVFWQIDPSHPEDYQFNLADQKETVKAVAESAMREVIGHSQIQNILTADRSAVEKDVLAVMQTTLEKYKAGVKVWQVQLLSVDPPDEVIASFREVSAAQQEQSTLRNQGEAYANKVGPESIGQAAEIVQRAEGYRTQTVAEAQGQAARFNKVYTEYKNAPEVTRERIYLETIEKVLSRSQKLVIDDPKGQGVVPYLPLPELGKAGSTP